MYRHGHPEYVYDCAIIYDEADFNRQCLLRLV